MWEIMFENIRSMLKKSLVFKITAVNSVIISASFLCVALVVCLINAAVSVLTERRIMEVYIRNVLNGVDNKLNDMARVSLIAFSDNITQDILQNIEYYSYAQRLESFDYLQKLYTNLINLRKDIHSVYLFNDRELVFYQTLQNLPIKTDYNMENFINFIKTIEERPAYNSNNYRMVITGPPEFLWYRPNLNPYDDTYIYITREVKTFSPNERIGHILLIAPVSALREVLAASSFPYFSFLLYSYDKTVIYSGDPSFPGRSLADTADETKFLPHDFESGAAGSYYERYNGKSSLISYRKSEYSGITLVTTVPLLFIFRNTILLSVLFVFLFLIVICAVIMLTGKYTKAVINPVVLLSETMSKFSRDDIRSPLPIDREDEAGRLSGAFNTMVTTIKDLIFQEYEKTIELKNTLLRNKEMQLRYLHAQINPHFLYNTLDNIRIKAALAGNTEVADMIMLLVEFFRGNVETASHLVSVKKEISLIKIYLDLMHYRYPNLEAEFNIDESLLEMEMPSFILQPIVENSLLHGLKTLNYSGRITVSLYRDTDNAILLTVFDNGLGLDDPSWAKIKAMLEAQDIDASQGEHHIGIINVAQRLRMFYDGNCGLSYRKNPGGGLTAIIRMGEKAEKKLVCCSAKNIFGGVL